MIVPRDPYRVLQEVGADLCVSMELVGVLSLEDTQNLKREAKEEKEEHVDTG